MSEVKIDKEPKRKELPLASVETPKNERSTFVRFAEEIFAKYQSIIRTSKNIEINGDGRLKIPVFTTDPSTCLVGEIAQIGGELKQCTPVNTWVSIGGSSGQFTSVKLTSNQTISSSSSTRVDFNSVISDTSSGWDATNFRVNILATGTYLISGHIIIDNINAGEFFRLRLTYGGTTDDREVGIETTNQSQSQSFSEIVNLNQGDTVQVSVKSDDTSYFVIGAATFFSTLQVKQL